MAERWIEEIEVETEWNREVCHFLRDAIANSLSH